MSYFLANKQFYKSVNGITILKTANSGIKKFHSSLLKGWLDVFKFSSGKTYFVWSLEEILLYASVSGGKFALLKNPHIESITQTNGQMI